MVARRLIAVSGLLAAASVCAEPLTYHLTDPAKKYGIDVIFPTPPSKSYEGAPATVILHDKAGGRELQRIESQDAYVTFTENGNQLEINRAPMYGDQSVLFFDDFNFDGQQDLAVRNGSEGGYGGPSYDVYLFDPASSKLHFNEAFSNLTRDGQLGMFGSDAKTRRLYTSSKSGCCWHQEATWAVIDNVPQMVGEKIEDATAGVSAQWPMLPQGYIQELDRELIDGQWKETSRFVGPYTEEPVMLRGTLNGKIAVDLWWQRQGEAFIGEVRYTKSGSGQPIRLIGEQTEEGKIVLHEFADDGRMTGHWHFDERTESGGGRIGRWLSGERDFTARMSAGEVPVSSVSLGPVTDDQRDGRYVMNNGDTRRSCELTLKMVSGYPLDVFGTADVQLSLMLKGQPSTSTMQRVRMWSNNLLFTGSAKEPEYRIQLLKGGVVLKSMGERGACDGAYLKVR